MGLQCRILIEKRPGGTLLPGDLVRGKISYSLSSHMAVSRIDVVLSGKAYCRWKVRRQKADEVYIGQETFLKQSINLLPQMKSYQDGKYTLEQGTYTLDFQFVLPVNIPYSYQEHMNYIKYNLKVKFVRPELFKMDKCFRHKLNVAAELNIYAHIYTPYRNPVTLDLVRPQTIFFKKVGEVTIRMQLQKTCAIPGEIIPVYCYIENNTELTLPCVKAKILQIRRLTANRFGTRHKETFDTVYKASPSEAIAGGEKRNVSHNLAVPTNVLPSLLHCNVIYIGYLIRVKVCFPGMRQDARLDVPLLIGNIPNFQIQLPLNREAENVVALPSAPPSYDKESAEAPHSSRQGLPPTYDAPPSYWEVMQLEDESEDEYGQK